MDSQTLFAKLRDVLARLYPTNKSARRLADDAGMDARRIRFSAQALENWHAILTEAVQTGRLDAMLNIAVTEYSSNGDLLAAYGTYRHFVGQGNQIVPLRDIEQRNQGDDRSITAQIGEGPKNVNIGQNITPTNIEGSVYTSGGDFTGRDKITHILGDEVHSDKVGGDKIVVEGATASTIAIGSGSIATSVKNFFFGSSEDTIRLRNRQAMLKLVHDIWVKGMLERSLYNQLLIDLDMEQRPEAVERPWGMVLETPDLASRLLPSGTKLIDVFTDLNQSLLILGEPGSGKSTMLLELARDLLTQAEQNPALPMPVLFNLSSWAEKRQPLRRWLVDELREKYQIPKTLAQTWVEHDELLLLLDGLDEVKREYREECIKALNAFQQSGKTLVPLALCSRTSEYEALTSKLKLNGAIVLHPLTRQQINTFLLRAGDKLSAVVYLLQQDTALQELAQSPLTLSIICLTYQEKAVADIQLLDSVGTRLHQLFNAYLMRMFQRPGKLTINLYPRAQTLHWLSWLAGRMVQHGQTLFLLEQMQPSWAQTTVLSRFMIAAAMLMWGPIYGLFYGPIYGLFYGPIYGLFFGLGEGLRDGLRDGLGGGLIVGLLFGLGEGLSGRFRGIKLSERLSLPWRRLRSSLYATLFYGLVLGLVLGLIVGLFFGLVGGLLFGLAGWLVGGFREVQLANPFKLSWKRLKSSLTFGMIVGLVVGLLVGLAGWFIGGLLFGLLYMLRVGLLYGLGGGLIVGLVGGLLFEPSVTLEIPYTTITQQPNQGIKLSTKYSIITGLVGGLVLGLVLGLLEGLFVGLRDGLRDGLLQGLLGWLLGWLFGWLLFGGISGGDVVTKHGILRFILWWKGCTPLNYARFLDYCADHIFLRKVGGGYVFVHRLLMEHFASLTEEDIKRLAG